MKLATALSQRADVQTKLEQISVRLNMNAKVQEGEKPAEDPVNLLKELKALIEELETLVTKINLTNANTLVDGEALTALLSKRDALQKDVSIKRDFLNSASSIVNRYSKTEIKILSTVDVARLQKELDIESKELRLLEEKIQSANWTTELM